MYCFFHCRYLWIWVSSLRGFFFFKSRLIYLKQRKKLCCRLWIHHVVLSLWMSLKYNIKLTGTCAICVCHCLFGVEWRETDLNRAGRHQSDMPPPPESSASTQSQLCSLLASLHIFCLAADSESSPVLLWQESKCEVIWGDLCGIKGGTGGPEPLRLEVAVPALSHGQVDNCGHPINPCWSDQDPCVTVRQAVTSHLDLRPGRSGTFNRLP